jgi:hypothetical protein
MSNDKQEPVEPETVQQLIKRRAREIDQGMKEAIRLEVERLRRNNLPVWISRNGRIYDATDELNEADRTK